MRKWCNWVLGCSHMWCPARLLPSNPPAAVELTQALAFVVPSMSVVRPNIVTDWVRAGGAGWGDRCAHSNKQCVLGALALCATSVQVLFKTLGVLVQAAFAEWRLESKHANKLLTAHRPGTACTLGDPSR